MKAVVLLVFLLMACGQREQPKTEVVQESEPDAYGVACYSVYKVY